MARSWEESSAWRLQRGRLEDRGGGGSSARGRGRGGPGFNGAASKIEAEVGRQGVGMTEVERLQRGRLEDRGGGFVTPATGAAASGASTGPPRRSRRRGGAPRWTDATPPAASTGPPRRSRRRPGDEVAVLPLGPASTGPPRRSRRRAHRQRAAATRSAGSFNGAASKIEAEGQSQRDTFTHWRCFNGAASKIEAEAVARGRVQRPGRASTGPPRRSRRRVIMQGKWYVYLFSFNGAASKIEAEGRPPPAGRRVRPSRFNGAASKIEAEDLVELGRRLPGGASTGPPRRSRRRGGETTMTAAVPALQRGRLEDRGGGLAEVVEAGGRLVCFNGAASKIEAEARRLSEPVGLVLGFNGAASKIEAEVPPLQGGLIAGRSWVGRTRSVGGGCSWGSSSAIRFSGSLRRWE